MDNDDEAGVRKWEWMNIHTYTRVHIPIRTNTLSRTREETHRQCLCRGALSGISIHRAKSSVFMFLRPSRGRRQML